MIVNDYELKYNNSNKCYKLCKLPRKLNLKIQILKTRYSRTSRPQGKQVLKDYEKHPQGPQGETGPQGLQGETGPQGPKEKQVFKDHKEKQVLKDYKEKQVLKDHKEQWS